MSELVALAALPTGALLLRLRFLDVALAARPGQFVDVRNHAGDSERLPVVGSGAGILEVESPAEASPLHEWLAAHAAVGAPLRVSGPHDRPR